MNETEWHTANAGLVRYKPGAGFVSAAGDKYWGVYRANSRWYAYRSAAHRLYHRVDGPAKMFWHGAYDGVMWRQKRRLHRVEGPAIQWEWERAGWYLEGVKFPEPRPWQRRSRRLRWLLLLTPHFS